MKKILLLIITMIPFNLLQGQENGYYRIKNRWLNTYINTEKALVCSEILPGWHSAIWSLEKVPNTNNFKIKNYWRGTYLNVEYGLGCSNILSAWQSAQWVLEKVEGTNFYRLKNVWLPKQYLNVETGKLRSSEILNGWWSAMWTLEPIKFQSSPQTPPPVATPPSRPKVWAVCIGVSDYAQNLNVAGLNDLTYCHIDAEKMYNFFRSTEGGSVPANQLSLLTNKQATKENILRECNRIFTQAAETDLIIFYFSGHGGRNLFCTHDNSLQHNELKNIIYGSKAKKKLCIADACHAGSWNKASLVDKAISSTQATDMYYEALGNSGDGIALFMASQTNETSIDDFELRQGLFTYYYIEGLKGFADTDFDKIITVQELYDYVKKKVSTRALAKWNNAQNPVLNGTFDHSMPVGVRVK